MQGNRKLVFVILTLSLLPMSPTAAVGSDESNPEQTIRDLEAKRREAILHRDGATLAGMLAPGMFTIDVDGNLHEEAAAGAVKLNTTPSLRTIERWDSSDMKVNVYGGHTAIVRQRVRIVDVLKGKRRDFTHWLTHVWVILDSRWQLVARQGTRTRD